MRVNKDNENEILFGNFLIFWGGNMKCYKGFVGFILYLG